jgi:DNA-binding HxlR family transcriptional regulator
MSQFAHHASFTVETLFRNKWRINILCAMRSGPIRLGQLARIIPIASKKVLTQNLRDLEAAGIITRSDLSDVVPRVEYELDQGIKTSILGLLDNLAQWGGAYLANGAIELPEAKRGGSQGGVT